MMNRRKFVSGLPLAATAWSLAGNDAMAAVTVSGPVDAGASGLASPPVVQHPAADSFTVTFRVNGLCRGWLEWGLQPDALTNRVMASHHGLVLSSDRVLTVCVAIPGLVPGRDIYYRVTAQPVAQKKAAAPGPVRRLRLPHAGMSECRLAVVNDTHENAPTLAAVARRIEELQPDALVWAGDTCRSVFANSPEAILLNPGASPSSPIEGGWAATRPLLFVPGNHDFRGKFADRLVDSLSPWPGSLQCPYAFAVRFGPLALVGLDTGEDKPDAYLNGEVACEPYHEAQARWLASAVLRPEIASAPFKVVIAHIPLRGLPGQRNYEHPDTPQDGAAYCDPAARLWMPTLARAGFHAVFSGHTHSARIDDPSAGEPVMQVVGGGPKLEIATVTRFEASAAGLKVLVETPQGSPLLSRFFPPT